MEWLAIAALAIVCLTFVVVINLVKSDRQEVNDLVSQLLHNSNRVMDQYAELHSRLMVDSDVAIDYRKALNSDSVGAPKQKAIETPTFVGSYGGGDFLDGEEIGT
jgi:hypothetical protein